MVADQLFIHERLFIATSGYQRTGNAFNPYTNDLSL